VKLTELSIPGLFLLESPVWADERGLFREWYKKVDLDEAGLDFPIQQANFAVSRRDVVRGLHYSLAPQGQAKLVTCAWGELVDVVVDIRVGSPTYGRVEMVNLKAGEERSVLVPAGAAHGYCVTSELGAITYLLSSPYDAPHELEIHPLDDAVGVAWPLSGEPVLSEKDAAAPTLASRRDADQLPHFRATVASER